MGKIPVYPGARPHPVKKSQRIATVRASLGEVVAFYEKALPRAGWQAAIPNDILNQDLDQVPLALLLYERGKTRLRIVLAAKEGKTTIWWGMEDAHGKPAR